jgi:hypothetical protein
MRLVQLKAGDLRRVAVVEEPKLRLLRDFDSVYGLAANLPAWRPIILQMSPSTMTRFTVGAGSGSCLLPWIIPRNLPAAWCQARA